jgi:hypothetical protein
MGFAGAESVLWGKSFDELVPLLELSVGGANGISSSFTPGRGLGGSGGGMGRVAEGASGTSSGFCCAARVPVNDPAREPASSSNSPSLNSALSFVPICKTSVFFSTALRQRNLGGLFQ